MKLKYFHDVKQALSFAYGQFVADMEQRNSDMQDVSRYQGEEMLEDIKAIRELILQAEDTKTKCDDVEQRLVQYWKLHVLLKEGLEMRHLVTQGLVGYRIEQQLAHIEELYGT